MIELAPIPRKSEFHPDRTVVTPHTDRKYAYYAVEKQKGRYVAVAGFYCAGDCCLAVAEKHFQARGFDVNSRLRVLDQTEWHAYQVRQHLRDVGIA